MKTRPTFWLALVAAVALFLAGRASAEEPLTSAELQDAYAVCAACNALLAAKIPEGALRSVVANESWRHGARVDDADMVNQTINAFAVAVNDGAITLAEIIETVEECSAL